MLTSPGLILKISSTTSVLQLFHWLIISSFDVAQLLSCLTNFSTTVQGPRLTGRRGTAARLNEVCNFTVIVGGDNLSSGHGLLLGPSGFLYVTVVKLLSVVTLNSCHKFMPSSCQVYELELRWRQERNQCRLSDRYSKAYLRLYKGIFWLK